jgi:hypothetical protein
VPCRHGPPVRRVASRPCGERAETRRARARRPGVPPARGRVLASVGFDLRRAGENARCDPHSSWSSAHSPPGRTGGTVHARRAPPGASCRARGWRAGGNAPRPSPPCWRSARSRPRAGVCGLRSLVSGRERAGWSSLVLDFPPTHAQGGRETRDQPATRLPSRGAARTWRVGADTQRSSPLPWHSAHSRPCAGTRALRERARTRGASASHPGIPPTHARGGREARDQPAPRLPTGGRRTRGASASHPGIPPAHARGGRPRNAAAAGPRADRCRRDVREPQWKAGTIR